jgi:hypothetical protein
MIIRKTPDIYLTGVFYLGFALLFFSQTQELFIIIFAIKIEEH